MTARATGQNLCFGCGYCCNGVLFDRAKVAPGEEARVEAGGGEIFEEDGQAFFRQPCAHSSCGRCTIYDDRFQICRSYECALLRSVRAGKMDLSSAQATVARARYLLGAVIRRSPAARTAGGRAEMRAKLASNLMVADAAERTRVSRRLLDIVALDSFLERWFREPKEKQSEM